MLIVPIGIPACGKSTLAKEYKKRGYKIINPDSIRKEMYGDYFKNTPELWETVGRRLDNCLSDDDGLCFIDATNVKRWERETHIRSAKDRGHKVKAIWIKTEPEIAAYLNEQRDRHVPKGVIYKKYYDLEPPEREEGFDEIETKPFPLTNELCKKIGGTPEGGVCRIKKDIPLD